MITQVSRPRLAAWGTPPARTAAPAPHSQGVDVRSAGRHPGPGVAASAGTPGGKEGVVSELTV